MKKIGLILSLAVTMMIAMVGCGNKSQVDTGKLESSFKSAEPAAQTAVTSAITKIKSTDYAGALVDLQSVAAKAKLTPDQEQVLKDVTAQVEKLVAAALKKTADAAGKEAQKAVGDLQKTLPK